MLEILIFMVNSVDLEGISIDKRKEILAKYDGEHVILCFYIEHKDVSYLFHVGGELNKGALRKEGEDRVIDYSKLVYIILMN